MLFSSFALNCRLGGILTDGYALSPLPLLSLLLQPPPLLLLLPASVDFELASLVVATVTEILHALAVPVLLTARTRK